ncbi:MAG: InlB B-repeat-containing protein, partial [Clostridia bacterium]|nr:InlB B-repeat-containing protein [Clostridia bacterium]
MKKLLNSFILIICGIFLTLGCGILLSACNPDSGRGGGAPDQPSVSQPGDLETPEQGDDADKEELGSVKDPQVEAVAWTGKGTLESPYVVASVADLQQLATDVNGGTTYSGIYFRQTQDISMSGTQWTIIDASSYSFAGIYDGNNRTISGLTYSGTNKYIGLFGRLSSATVKNVILTSVSLVSTTSSYVGGISGYVSTTSTIKNCRVLSGNIKATGSSIGGIVGYVNKTGCTITNCYNKSSLSVGLYGGGIVGWFNAYTTVLKITNCYNEGKVELQGEGLIGGDVGGVLGVASGSSYCKVNISNCYNTGAISAIDSAPEMSYSAGGIIGSLETAGNSGRLEMKNCFNTGSVSVVNHGANVGGIIGELTVKKSSDKAYIDNCYNIGALRAEGSGYGAYLGGIAGTIEESYSNSITISYCFNYATHTVVCAYSSGNGGIVGYSDDQYHSVVSCYYGKESSQSNTYGGVYSSSLATDAKKTSWDVYQNWGMYEDYVILSGQNSGFPVLTFNKIMSTYAVTYNANGGIIESASSKKDYARFGEEYGKANIYNYEMNRLSFGSGNIWVADEASAKISVSTSTTTAVSYANFFQPYDGLFCASTKYSYILNVTENTYTGTIKFVLASPNDAGGNQDVATDNIIKEISGTGIYSGVFNTASTLGSQPYNLRSFIIIPAGSGGKFSFQLEVFVGDLYSNGWEFSAYREMPSTNDLPVATRSGYDFDGWYKENSFVNKVDASTIVSTSAAHTLYAKWTLRVYTMTINYKSENSTNLTNVGLSVSSGTLAATTLSVGGSTTWKQAYQTSSVTLTVSASNSSSYDYYIRFNSAPTSSSYSGVDSAT